MARTHLLKGHFFSVMCIAAILMSVSLPLGCSRDESRPQTKPSGAQGFTFFDLGTTSQYSHSVRKDLSQKLGSDAISQKNTMDLSIHYQGFLEKHFPAIAELHRRLNWPPRRRVEHDTTKLVYRDARRQDTPFTYVELFFSDDSRKPLFFSITAGPEAAAIVDTSIKKYGSPKEFEWGEGKSRTRFWEKGRDVFLISSFKNRRNDLEYLLCIYFAENLDEMLKTEEVRRLAEEEKIRKTGKSAF
ncbi:MAG: hypothetical protein COZ70_15840 [Deltaproteobacteria bacterium CG_4_8_14_3_um_filter_51_11]|nr:hypothetical protein [bacterium]OIP41656.1 MAG: hypothetical protein AUK25_05260 [Desulfobacteraceae bacterium CG2_30_51_40]PIP46175.1 MAG: hypothetical protein COX16_09880 [Deltaproteobacteria bacterium CG23_combo_of_CG06-09_8_20_14_all_51_20]PIV98982.1 MAG: hypothetical protein COW41_09055 [Deltaproteobacteria bacterium CG17_big_fil_post_rev_8_21_14_2_50_51_6]PIX18123.1 MAG: hypothetical protein COZ70_15840 [Deltaproteobacteria bacterium CG_4_8_14_3_um_filter_51_11]PIY22573.1 MAG: hypothe